MQKFMVSALSVLSLASSSLACSVVNGVKFTAYGFPDASGIPAYKCNGNTVVPTTGSDRTQLGDGSYGSPYSAAAASGSIFSKCQLLYMPLLKKYFRVQDDCSGCVSSQTDLYIVQANQDVGQTPCEFSFGSFNYGQAGHEVIQDPGPNLEVDTRPLFENGKCFNDPSDGRVYLSQDGTINCDQRQSTMPINDIATKNVTSGPLSKNPPARRLRTRSQLVFNYN